MTEAKETQRLEAFSDGIFAIAVTLLILEVRVPHDLPPGTTLLRALVDLWPAYLAYLTSFATILIMWINHHALLAMITRTDHAFMLLNGLLLLIITAINFPTALVAEYIGHDGERVAAQVYAGTGIAMALAFNFLWWYSSAGGRLISKGADPAVVRAVTWRYAFGPLYYGVAFLLAYVNAAASFGFCLLLAIFFAIPFTTRRRVGGS